MTQLELFKRRVGYRTSADQNAFTADGTSVIFNLQNENVFEVIVYFASEQQESGFTVDSEPGTVLFDAAPPEGVVITFQYKFAPFTDDEATELINTYGLDNGVIEALRQLLASSSRRMNYKSADTEVEYSQVYKQIKDLLTMYQNDQLKDESGQTSGVTIGHRRDPRDTDCYERERDVSRLYG